MESKALRTGMEWIGMDWNGQQSTEDRRGLEWNGKQMRGQQSKAQHCG